MGSDDPTDGRERDTSSGTGESNRVAFGVDRRAVLRGLGAGAVGVGVATGTVRAATPRFPTLDATPSRTATFEGRNGSYTISAAGHDVWRDADEYGAIYAPRALRPLGSGGFVTVETTITEQDRTNPWAKAGLMAGPDLTAPGSSPNDVVVGVTPDNGFLFDWDADGDGYLDTHQGAGTTEYPCALRLRLANGTNTGRGVVAYGGYSTDGGDTWTQIGRTELPESVAGGDDAGDVALFVTSHDQDTSSTVSFDGFDVMPSYFNYTGAEAPTIDATLSQSAAFYGRDGDYRIRASGHDVWRDADEYAAVYEPDARDPVGPGQRVVAETQVIEQERTHEWAKTGLIAATDITAPGSSPHDLVVGVTPDHGFLMDWDADGDGFIDTHRGAGTTTYPCRLRLQIANPEGGGLRYTGEFSTEATAGWTEIGTVRLAASSAPGDVGVFATSHDRATPSAVRHQGFGVRSSGLPRFDATPTGSLSVSSSEEAKRLLGPRSVWSVSAAGHDVWRDADEYGTVYTPNVSDWQFVETILRDQERVHEWTKAGIVAASDVTAPGVSSGDLVVGVTPDHGFLFDWDADGDGFLDTHRGAGQSVYPCGLRLRNTGDAYVGEYLTGYTLGGSGTEIGRVESLARSGADDLGVFVTSHERDTPATARFVGLNVGRPVKGYATTDATPTDDAVLATDRDGIRIRATGHDVWRDADEYATVYEPNVSRDFRAETTLAFRSTPHPWTKAGIMVSEDLRAAGAARNDLVVAVTPDHGFLFDWDANGDGFIDTHRGDEDAALQGLATLTIERSGNTFTAGYDNRYGSQSFGSVTLPAVDDVVDVGVFLTAHDRREHADVSFTEFQVR